MLVGHRVAERRTTPTGGKRTVSGFCACDFSKNLNSAAAEIKEEANLNPEPTWQIYMPRHVLLSFNKITAVLWY